MGSDVVSFGPFRLDIGRRELKRGGATAPLKGRALEVLCVLAQARGELVSKDDLMRRVWPGIVVEENNLQVHISALRRALGEAKDGQPYIVTAAGRGYRLLGVQAEAPVASTDALPAPILMLPDNPSIAVLAFTNLSGDPEQGYFADGIAEDIITELSRFSELFVIARNSSFKYKGQSPDIRQVGRELGVRYVLEGSTRRANDRVRITAQLIDAHTGIHRWADRYDRRLEDIFEVQDDVARTIASILASHVEKAEFERTALRPPTSWQAHDYFVRGAGLLHTFLASFRKDDLHEARQQFRQALQLDPSYARAYAQLSIIDSMVYAWAIDDDYLNPEILERSIQLGRKAVQLAPDLPIAHACLVLPLCQKDQHDAAVAAIDKAMTSNPSFTEARFILGLVWAGEHQRAIQLAHRHMRADPFYSPFAPLWLGLAHYMLEDYAQALPAILDSLARTPNARGPHQQLAMTFAQMGRLEEAQAEAAEVLRIEPGYTLERVARVNRFKIPRHAEHFLGGLRKAGLPG